MFQWMNDNRFGVVTTRLILIVVMGMALLPLQPTVTQPNSQIVTFLSGLPQANLSQPLVVSGLQLVVVLASVLWLLGWVVPICCWVAVLGFAGLAALRIENAAELCHCYYLIWLLLLIHAIWYSCYFAELAVGGTVQNRGRHYPAWVFGLSIFVFAWFHTMSGIGKWMSAGADWTSGWVWADGISLQLWLHALGNPTSRLSQWLINDQSAAVVAQRALLLIELTALCAVFNASWRRIVGLLLTVYYVFFLHCFVDWFALLAEVGLGSSTIVVSAGAPFPALSYAFQMLWIVWLFLVSDQMLGRWEKAT
jgi:hypothetical protein